jgi:hypothetical protein
MKPVKKQYILFLFLAVFQLFFIACSEDESFDITIMPEETAVGANTFGCLVDGWIYVGGRYFEAGYKPIEFFYFPNENEVSVRVHVKKDNYIFFTIENPIEGGQSKFTDFRFDSESFPDGKVIITRFDKEAQIISGHFDNEGRILHGRFDVKYELTNYPPVIYD